MKAALKRYLFGLLGKDPEAVVVSFATGTEDKVLQMVADARKAMPDRRHYVVGETPLAIPGITFIPVGSGSLISELRRKLSHLRIGMAPVLFDGSTRHSALRRAAFLLAPTKLLAYNNDLERHHLHFFTPIASLLFWRGVPLDRIHLRPAWLRWLTHDHTVVPNDGVVMQGRPQRPGMRRMAVLTPFAPYPLSHGGAVRLYYMLRALSRQFDVFVLCFREQETPESIRPLLDFCTEVAMVTKPRYREPRWSTLLPPEVKEYESQPMRDLLARLRKQRGIELVQVEYTQLARYPGDILVEHDVTFDLYSQIHDAEGSLQSWWNLWRWKRFERAALARFRKVITMSGKDAGLLGTGNIVTIPNGVDLKRFTPAPETDGMRLLFIGSFRHFPNVTAFRFFMERVWPLVADRLPAMHVTIVAGPDPELYYRDPLPGSSRIRIHAFVQDVRPLYGESNIVLVPTLVSAGTNVKVIEAMAMQRAIVSTTSGCGGIDVKSGEHVMIADGADAFAAAIVWLAESPGERHRLAANARRLAEERYDWGTLGEMQVALAEELMPDPIAIREGNLGDVGAVRSIQREALASSRWDATDYLQHEFYVAIFESVLAGFIVARYTAPDEREILNVAVLPEHRGKGIGERLLRRVLTSGSLGDVFLEVRESNERAKRLYERIGFENVGRRPGYYDDPPETAVIMRIKVQ